MSLRVLLVDDEIAILRACQRVLRKSRFELFVSSDPKVGLSMVEEHGPFAVVLADASMPGMSGIALLERVAVLAPATSRVLFTGRNDISRVPDVRLLRKPCGPRELLQCIEDGAARYAQARRAGEG